MDSFFSPPSPPPSLVLFHSRGISKRLPRRLNSIFCFVVCLQQRLKMDIGVLASLRAFKTPPMSSPRNDHIRGTAANIQSVGFISRGKQWSSSQQFFGGVVICQLFSQALFVLSRSLFFQKSENLLLVKISKHFAFEKIWKLVCLSHVLSTTSYGLLRPPSSKDSVQPGEVKETPKSKRKRCFFWIISDFQKTNSDFRKQDLIFKTNSNFRKPTLIFKNKLHFRKIKLWFCSVKQLCTLTKPPKSIVTGVTEGHARLIFAPAKRAAHWPIKSRNFFSPEVYY